MTRLTSCPDAESVAQRAAETIELLIAGALERRGAAHVALSGGTTPGRTFELLAAGATDWAAVHVWFADERCVGPDDPQSNYLLASQKLIGPAGIARERVHRMEGELGPAEASSRYAHELATLAPRSDSYPAGPPVLDVILLGIGPDGHVASLFPGAASLEAGTDALCLGIQDSPKPPPQRLTLSLAVLRAARSCVLLATGASKADAVQAMLGEPTAHVPASLLARERLTVILDDAAAPAGPRT